MTTPGKKERRRAILAAAVRWPLAAGLALLAARLLGRNAGGPLDPDEKCVNRGRCRRCRTLATCRAPQAQLFRQGAPADSKTPERRLS